MKPFRLALLLLASAGAVPAADPKPADPAAVAFFEQKVRPVLAEHCYACHSATAKKLKGGLRLDTRAGWQRGGDSGAPSVVPGKPGDSPLVKAVRHLDGLDMPPGKKLPDAVLADLVTWVAMGAPDPRTESAGEAKRADKNWWSLQPVKPVPPPAVANPVWNANPIDRFVFAKLAEKKLTPNPPADARTLIRRMSYDVTGLPPTPEEVDAFSGAYAGNPDRAVAALADRLLASPHYGEHWGRHWLDVVRFGESNGFERNFVIDDLWPFRDYVINSFNADKPFNQFVVEHLAGDVVGKDRPEVEVGTAFLVAGPYDDVGNQDPVAQANIRAATLDDVITATGGAFLGLTVNCARCHHHKFDPIPTEDYYRLRAAFEGVEHGRRVVATAEERAAFAAAAKPLQQELARLGAERAKLDDALTARAAAEWKARSPARPKADPQLTEDEFPPVEAKSVRFVVLATTSNPKGPGAAKSPTGGGGVGARLTEFEVWTAGPEPRNVALAAAGATAEGARSVRAEDFPEAYGPQLAIDGRHGEQWFIGDPAVLTVTFAKPETVTRVTFSNAKGKNLADKAQGATPCEYEVQVSLDGTTWRTVAGGGDRAPWTTAHGVERVRRETAAGPDADRLADLDREIAGVQRRLAAVPKLRQVWAGNFTQPKGRTTVHKGGDPMKPADPVAPASLSVLGHAGTPFELPPDAAEGQRRLALAKWIADDANPLTPRVLANRVWHYHFGTGIVGTPSDFGFLGGLPTHPELLDWLAGRLVATGWRMKPLHRELLLSQTFRQSSAFRPEAAGADKDARYLWRFPPRRLSAEEVRDTMLVVSGKLDPAAGGPGFRLYKFTQNNVCTYFPLDRHGPETYRRAVYHQTARASVVDLLTDYDLPDTAFASPRRAQTLTPLQALTQLNHPFTLDMAAALAGRAKAADPGATVDAAFRFALQRPPTAAERTAAIDLLNNHGERALGRAVLNLNELLFLE